MHARARTCLLAIFHISQLPFDPQGMIRAKTLVWLYALSTRESLAASFICH